MSNTLLFPLLPCESSWAPRGRASVDELPGKLRSQTRNARKVEAEITALKISSLKRLNKGSRIIIIDQ